MERLTWKDESGYYAPKNVTLNALKKRGELVDRLAAYEDTGLEPEEIKSFVSTADNIVKLDVNKLYPDAKITMYGKPLSHWQELSKAEQEGRLIVLPCKVGDTIYRFSRERDEVWDWQIEEIRILSGDYCDPISFVDDSENEFFASDIGKTVFLTRAEAEAAMKGDGMDA